jgi:hypothetical protein
MTFDWKVRDKLKGLLFIIGLASWWNSSSQNVLNYEIPAFGDIELAEGISIPKINSGYTVWMPQSKEIQGLVVFMHPRRDTVNSEFIIDYANENHLAIMYVTTDNRLEFLFEKTKAQELENYIASVVNEYEIPMSNVMYCGMSLAGTRALKMAIFGQSDRSKHHLKPLAIAICDSPLDMVRFYNAMIRAKELQHTPITANEGNWVSSTLEKNLNGTPREEIKAYTDYSPYCYNAKGGIHLDDFQGIAIRAYTEPDVNWWIETRRKDYYSMNSIDLAAFINELKINNHNMAELITTSDKGFLSDRKRHPHSWSIVDEKELIDWFLQLLEERNRRKH